MKFYATYHYFVLTPLLTLLISVPTVAAATTTDTQAAQSFNPDHLLAFEIEGISLQIDSESIPSILHDHGYKQTSDTMYTKQNLLPGGRKSNYRIEVHDTETSRQINYFRGKSGGRIKSSTKEEDPINAEEIETVTTLYEIVCSDPTALSHHEHKCPPMSASSIQIGQGELVQIGKNFGVKLNASEATTTIEIKFSE